MRALAISLLLGQRDRNLGKCQSQAAMNGSGGVFREGHKAAIRWVVVDAWMRLEQIIMGVQRGKCDPQSWQWHLYQHVSISPSNTVQCQMCFVDAAASRSLILLFKPTNRMNSQMNLRQIAWATIQSSLPLGLRDCKDLSLHRKLSAWVSMTVFLLMMLVMTIYITHLC